MNTKYQSNPYLAFDSELIPYTLVCWFINEFFGV